MISAAAPSTFRVGDMLSPALGRFSHVVAMDSLIHYPTAQIVCGAGPMGSSRTDWRGGSMIFTFAPQTPLLVGDAWRWACCFPARTAPRP